MEVAAGSRSDPSGVGVPSVNHKLYILFNI
jgi:hypothetical protein